jgi:starch synthase (maltosyl-transferring)
MSRRPERIGSMVIEGVAPSVDGGRHPAKRVLGEEVQVWADVFKEGHDELVAVVRFRQVAPQSTDWEEAPLRAVGNDRFMGSFRPAALGRYVFTVEAWPDLFATWSEELKRKLSAGRDVSSELLEGAALLRQASSRAALTHPQDAQRLREAAEHVQAQRAEVALDPGLRALAAFYPDRAIGTRHPGEFPLIVERERARSGAWYEFFPRSSGDKGRHGTFADASRHLDYVRELGFDVVYLPPIHPIGRTARKGPNNALIAGPGDPGSPWAIGAAEGGHKAVHPELGTVEDFKRFVRRAEALGIEVALDLAYQCSPDHPYVREHPEWFHHRPDGTIKTAENPPKRYEDIVNFDFLGPAREALWQELRSVVLFWVEAGVRLFRVDNPHTKPLPFWEWLIREVQAVHPEVVMLSEAFTRPKVMKALAKLGFSQSYTYFTWRNFKHELEEYLTELTSPPVSDFMRGNLWPNTPDILPEALQQGGPATFRIRLALAATLSSSYGIYSGYELCEGRALPGKEEYQDSEKYQLVAWDWDRPGNIRGYVATINRLRAEHRALREYANLRFHPAHNDRVLFYSKRSQDGNSALLCAVSLDPYAPQEAVLDLPLPQLGIPPEETYQAHELITDQRALWQGATAHVRLTPEQPAAIWSVLRFRRSEHGFDYYD